MALVQPTQPITPGKKGGAGLGALLGLGAGLAATVLTGGLAGPVTMPMVTGALGAMTGGSAVGGAIGGQVSKSKAATQAQNIEPTEGSMTRKLKSGDAIAQLNQLKDSAMAASQLAPEQRAQYLEPMLSAAEILKSQARRTA